MTGYAAATATGGTACIDAGPVRRVANSGGADPAFTEPQTSDDLRDGDIERLEDVCRRV